MCMHIIADALTHVVVDLSVDKAGWRNVVEGRRFFVGQHIRFSRPAGHTIRYDTSISINTVLVLLYVFSRHSRSELARYLFYYMFFLFVRSTISRQPAGRFTPKFACGRSLVPDVSSPLLGVGSPRPGGKKGNEIFVTMGVNGEFLHFGGFW